MKLVKSIERLSCPLMDTEEAIIKYSTFFPEYPSFTHLTKEQIMITSHRLTVLGIAGRITQKNGLKKETNTIAVLAQCECGKTIVTSLKDIKANKIKSCGCYHKETSRITGLANINKGKFSTSTKSLTEKSLIKKRFDDFFPNKTNDKILRKKRVIYIAYCDNSFLKKREFTLTPIEFIKILESPCFYCGQFEEKYSSMGIDRHNNNSGYNTKNSVPCCRDCNYMKSDHTVEYFLKKVKQILSRKTEILKHNNF